MGVFKSARVFTITVPDLDVVAKDVAEHFEANDYEVARERTLTGGWDISIAKGKLFKSILGLKTALKISIESDQGTTKAQAGVGIFGLQAIPTAITYFVFPPLIFAQIWGMAVQCKLDEEAMETIETSLKDHGRETAVVAGNSQGTSSAATGVASLAFCTECGSALVAGAKFCPGCGTSIG